MGYNRFFQDYPIPQGLQYPGLSAFPNIVLEELAVNIGPDSNAPQSTIQNTYQVIDNLNWVKGKHTFKFGGEYRKFISPQHFIQRERGDYDYNTLDLFLRDQVPDVLAERNVGSTQYYGDQYAIYWYVNDTFKIRPNFTVNLGLRYEYTSNPYTYSLQALNSVSDVPGVITFGVTNNPEEKLCSASWDCLFTGKQWQHLHSSRFWDELRCDLRQCRFDQLSSAVELDN